MEEGLMTARAEIIEAPDTVRLTAAEVSTATGVARSTLRKWACLKPHGALLPITKRAGRNLYRPSDLRRWLGVDFSGGAA